MFAPAIAEDLNLAGRWRQQAFEDFDGGRLARAIGAEQPEAFAFVDLQIQTTNGFNLALIGFLQVAAADSKGHHSMLPESCASAKRRPATGGVLCAEVWFALFYECAQAFQSVVMLRARRDAFTLAFHLCFEAGLE